MKYEWFGQAGHFICSYDCLFHLHTHVKGYCVSTVGEYYPRRGKNHPADGGSPETIGADRLYETMVFKLDDAGETNGESLDFDAYNDRDAANAGHMAMLRRWSKQ